MVKALELIGVRIPSLCQLNKTVYSSKKRSEHSSFAGLVIEREPGENIRQGRYTVWGRGANGNTLRWHCKVKGSIPFVSTKSVAVQLR